MIIKPTRREFIKSAALAGGALLAPKLLMAGGAPSYGQTELIHTIRRCGLTSGLKVCLDAGDANSAPSATQTWYDLSGGGYDFFVGFTASAQASDPTQNGTAGRRSSGEYWSFDGGDYFRYDSATEAWMENLHKDNAKFTFFTWVHVPATTVAHGLCGTEDGNGANPGAWWDINGTEQMQFAARRTAGASNISVIDSTVIPSGVWVCLALSVDEAVGANGGLFFVSGTTTTFTSTYTTPDTAAAQGRLYIGSLGASNFPMENTCRMGMFAVWESVALTKPQLLALYQSTRGRFGV